MEAMEMIKERRSIRSFTEEKVTNEKLKEIIELATYSPSWKNSQIVRYNIVQDEDILEKIIENGVLNFEFNQKTIKKANGIAILSYVKEISGYEKDGSFTTSKGDAWEMFDAGIASQTFCLAAHNLGVGTVIMGIFDENKVGEIINLPKNEKVAAIIAYGVKSKDSKMPPRKSVDEVSRFI